MYKVSCNIFFAGKPFGSPDTKKSQILLHARHRPTNTKLGLRFLNAIIYLIVIGPYISESCGESADNKAWNLGVKEGEKKSLLE